VITGDKFDKRTKSAPYKNKQIHSTTSTSRHNKEYIFRETQCFEQRIYKSVVSKSESQTSIY